MSFEAAEICVSGASPQDILWVSIFLWVSLENYGNWNPIYYDEMVVLDSTDFEVCCLLSIFGAEMMMLAYSLYSALLWARAAPTQLSAYANHEFKIIPTPAQLSAYANHELKNWYC